MDQKKITETNIQYVKEPWMFLSGKTFREEINIDLHIFWRGEREWIGNEMDLNWTHLSSVGVRSARASVGVSVSFLTGSSALRSHTSTSSVTTHRSASMEERYTPARQVCSRTCAVASFLAACAPRRSCMISMLSELQTCGSPFCAERLAKKKKKN